MKHYEFPTFGFYDYTGMACHFEKRAQQGWLLEKMGGFLWRYRRIEPRRLKFAVTYFPNVTGFEPGTPDSNARMREFCQQAGWILAADPGKFQVYYHEDPNAVELETEPEIQVETIHKTMKKNFLPSYSMLLLLSAMNVFLEINRLTGRFLGALHTGTVEYLSGFRWLSLPVWGMLFLLYLWEISRYLLWHRRAVERAEDGLMTPSPGSRKTQVLAFVLLFLILLGWGLTGLDWRVMAASAGVLIGVAILSQLPRKVMQKAGVKARTNRKITVILMAVLIFACTLLLTGKIIREIPRQIDTQTYTYQGRVYQFYADSIPLTLEDLGYPADPYPSARRIAQHSPLISRVRCFQSPSKYAPDQPRLDYVVADVHLSLLMELCQQDFLRLEHNPIDPAPWGADLAWRCTPHFSDNGYTYVLQKEGRLVYLTVDTELNEEQMTAVGDNLLNP